MAVSSLIAIAAAVFLVFLISLFAIETRNDKRIILTSVRNFLDRAVLFCALRLSRLNKIFGLAVVRIIFLYTIHAILGWVVRTLRRLQARMENLQHRNRRAAKNIQKLQKESHLSSVAQHKAAVSLTETQKNALKSKHLEG